MSDDYQGPPRHDNGRQWRSADERRARLRGEYGQPGERQSDDWRHGHERRETGQSREGRDPSRDSEAAGQGRSQGYGIARDEDYGDRGQGYGVPRDQYSRNYEDEKPQRAHQGLDDPWPAGGDWHGGADSVRPPRFPRAEARPYGGGESRPQNDRYSAAYGRHEAFSGTRALDEREPLRSRSADPGQSSYGGFRNEDPHYQRQQFQSGSRRDDDSRYTPRSLPKGYTRSDERVREDVCERLSYSGADVSEVEVKVKDGRVTLEGVVDNRRLKHRLEDIADECMGVSDVDNRIRVQAGKQAAQSAGSPGGAGRQTKD